MARLTYTQCSSWPQKNMACLRWSPTPSWYSPGMNRHSRSPLRTQVSKSCRPLTNISVSPRKSSLSSSFCKYEAVKCWTYFFKPLWVWKREFREGLLPFHDVPRSSDVVEPTDDPLNRISDEVHVNGHGKSVPWANTKSLQRWRWDWERLFIICCVNTKAVNVLNTRPTLMSAPLQSPPLLSHKGDKRRAVFGKSRKN